MPASELRCATGYRNTASSPCSAPDDLTVDLVHRSVRLGDVPVDLTPREYEVLRVLVQHAGKVLTHQFLIRQVWGGAVDVQNLRVVIRQLRQKLEPAPEAPHIRTETGVGYRLQVWNDTTQPEKLAPVADGLLSLAPEMSEESAYSGHMASLPSLRSPARRRVMITRTAADYEIAGSADLPPHLVDRAG